jgi:hypothetical protein
VSTLSSSGLSCTDDCLMRRNHSGCFCSLVLPLVRFFTYPILPCGRDLCSRCCVDCLRFEVTVFWFHNGMAGYFGCTCFYADDGHVLDMYKIQTIEIHLNF